MLNHFCIVKNKNMENFLKITATVATLSVMAMFSVRLIAEHFIKSKKQRKQKNKDKESTISI